MYCTNGFIHPEVSTTELRPYRRLLQPSMAVIWDFPRKYVWNCLRLFKKPEMDGNEGLGDRNQTCCISDFATWHVRKPFPGDSIWLNPGWIPIGQQISHVPWEYRTLWLFDIVTLYLNNLTPPETCLTVQCTTDTGHLRQSQTENNYWKHFPVEYPPGSWVTSKSTKWPSWIHTCCHSLESSSHLLPALDSMGCQPMCSASKFMLPRIDINCKVWWVIKL